MFVSFALRLKKFNFLIHFKVRDIDYTSAPRDVNAPGEQGKPVHTEKWEEDLVRKGWHEVEFNQYVSDKIPFERSIPDTRTPG